MNNSMVDRPNAIYALPYERQQLEIHKAYANYVKRLEWLRTDHPYSHGMGRGT